MSQGKLIEIHFSETGKISGANIQTCKFTCTDYFPELSCSLLICNYYFLKVQNWPWFESVLLLLIVHSFTWKGNSLSLWSIVLAHLVFINSICFFSSFFWALTSSFYDVNSLEWSNAQREKGHIIYFISSVLGFLLI